MNFSVLSSAMASAASESGRAVATSLQKVSGSSGDAGPVASGGSALQQPAVRVDIDVAVMKKAQDMQKQMIQGLINPFE